MCLPLQSNVSLCKHVISFFSPLCASSVAQSCLTLCDPMDCSPPASSVHEILQAKILEWVAISSPRRFSQPRIKRKSLVSPALPVSYLGSLGK